MASMNTCSQTRVIQTHMVMPPDTNIHGTLFGGRLMEYLDVVAAISLRRHTKLTPVTASMDTLNFIKPFDLDHSVCIETIVSGVGSKSVEVFAKVIGEDLTSGERYLGATAFLTFVVTNAERDFEMPVIKPETEEEIYVCSGYQKRRADRMEKRASDKEFQEKISIDLPYNT